MPETYADKFWKDPRVQQGIALILAALKEQQSSLTHIQSPDPALKDAYTAKLNELGQMRGGKLYYPYLGTGFGAGPLVELLDGSVKYDFISGIGVHYFGHSHPDIVKAALEAGCSDAVMQGNLQQNEDVLDLTRTLTQAAQLEHCILTTSGAMANENALKLAFQKHTPANRVLAFSKCFSGRTCTLSQISDKPSYREGLPVNLAVDYLPFYDATQPQASLERTMNALKQLCERYPKQHAAILIELIQGEGGFYPGETSYFRTLMEECRRHHIAIIADEIQTFGRTSHLFAHQTFGVTDLIDIATTGKLLQVCATLFRNEYLPRPGLISQTFTGSTSAIHAALVILRQLLNDGFLGENGKICRLGNYFRAKLQQIAERHPGLVQGPYGMGTMVAFTPIDGKSETVTNALQKLFQAGVIAFMAGSHPTRIRFLLPAGCATEKDIDAVATIVEKTLLEINP